MANYTEYDHTRYGSGQVYPLQNPLKQGRLVSDPDVNPAGAQANARFVNGRNEKIDFYVEDLTAGFGMTGSTAQSRNLRQFLPHNISQPTITVKGRAPNSFQYNRMASFVRASHFEALNPERAEISRYIISDSGAKIPANTVRFVLFSRHHKYPYNGRNVKGIHAAWALEGYIKSMKAGGQRFNPAPPFEFEFFIAETQFHGNRAMWEDSRVLGSELSPWLVSGEFVRPQEPKSPKSNKSPETPKTHSRKRHQGDGGKSESVPVAPIPVYVPGIGTFR